MTLEIYKLSEEREKKMWEEAIFIFDTSALLDFYFLPLTARNKVFNNLFPNKLSGRLWLPSQVKYEYFKNRESTIKKPISENYKPLKEKNLKTIINSISSIENQIKDLKNRTQKDDKHPFLKQLEIDAFTINVEEFKKKTTEFENSIIKQIDEIEDEISKLSENDDVEKAINDFFTVGRTYKFTELYEISIEGDHRYKYLFPPGYEDLKDKEKKGIQIFGDLIIWKQILEFSKNAKKPIIFICNDLKEDWCVLAKNTTEKRIESPREELIKEIYDYSGVEFWMYNQPQFLHNANKYYNAQIEKQNIEILSHFISDKYNSGNELIISCSKCGAKHIYYEDELNFEYECVGSYERNMGTENQYEAVEVFDCDCGNEIIVTFSIWEYPLGAQNYYEVGVDGGKLISSFPLNMDFSDEPDFDNGYCMNCGTLLSGLEFDGLCEKCDPRMNK